MKKKIFNILFIAIFMLLVFNIKVNASTYIVSTDKQVNSGDGNVTITITSKIALGAYNLELIDAVGLELESSNGGPTGTANGNKISGSSPSSGVTELGSYTFKIPSVTTDTTYRIKFRATGLADVQRNELGSDDNEAVLTVKATKTETPIDNNSANNNTSSNSGSSNNNTSNNSTAKSSEARLRDLGITPNDFTGFNGDQYEWSCEVPNEVEKVYIYATPKDSNANVKSGEGNVALKEGENKFEIVVVAEDGKTKKTYTLNITRKAGETTNTTPVEEPVIDEQPKTESTTSSTAEITSSTTISENTKATTSTTKTESTSTKTENQIVGKVDWLKPETWKQEQYILVAILAFLILTIIISVILKIKLKNEEEEIEFPGAEELDRAMYEHQELSDNGDMDNNYYNEDNEDENPYSTNFNDDYYTSENNLKDEETIDNSTINDEIIKNQPVEVEYKEENTSNDYNNISEKNDENIERKRMLEEYFANQDERNTKVRRTKTKGKHF